jgi:release factor glutamine methyltransferase
MKLQEWLVMGEAQLQSGPHPERARRDAEALLLHIVRRNRASLLAHREEYLEPENADRFTALLTRRATGEPMQYIFGEAEFYGLPFRVTPDVLIPRPETEHLVEKVIELTAHLPQPRIIDVGTGSGAIAIALAHYLPIAQITAIDISAAALAIAEENAEQNKVAIRFLSGDLLDAVTGESFDIVVANPPYVAANDRNSLSIEVRDYEPALALFAGDDGLAIYRRLVPAAFAALAPGGYVALEIGCGQTEAVQALLVGAAFHHVEFTPDLQGIPRVVSAQRD